MRHARIQQAKPERSFAERIVAVIVAIAMLGGMGYATTSAALAEDTPATVETTTDQSATTANESTDGKNAADGTDADNAGDAATGTADTESDTNTGADADVNTANAANVGDAASSDANSQTDTTAQSNPQPVNAEQNGPSVVADDTGSDCIYAGKNALQRVCWLDMSKFDSEAAKKDDGQKMTVNLGGGLTMSFTAHYSGGRTVVASKVPTWDNRKAHPGEAGHHAIFGVEGYSNFPTGSKPALYQGNEDQNDSRIQLSDITIAKNGQNVASLQYSFVMADAESTNKDEQMVYTSDSKITELGSYPTSDSNYGFCNQIFLNDETVTCTGEDEDSVPQGIRLYTTSTPTQVSIEMRNSGPGSRQGAAFGVIFSQAVAKITVNGLASGDANTTFKARVSNDETGSLESDSIPSDSIPSNTAESGTLPILASAGETKTVHFYLEGNPVNWSKYDVTFEGTDNGKVVSSPTIQTDGSGRRYVDMTVAADHTVQGHFTVTAHPDPLGTPDHHKTIAKKDGTNDTYTLNLNVTGKRSSTSQTVSQPVDIALVLDNSGSMDYCMSGRQPNYFKPCGGDDPVRSVALKRAVTAFLDGVDTQNETIANAGNKVRVSLVSFADSASTLSELTPEVTKLKTKVKNLNPGGATNTAAGFSEANSTLNKDTRTNAIKYVVFFTDGVPTTGTAFDNTVANNTLETAKQLKGANVGVYSVGIFSGAKTSVTSCNRQSNETRKANVFMNAVSSNYPNYGSVTWKSGVTLSGGSDKGYYKTASTASELSKVFEDIQQTITTTNGYTGVTIQDTLSEYAEFADANPAEAAKVFDSHGTDVTAQWNISVKGKMISASPESTKPLPDGVTYTLRFDIKPTQEAYDKYAANLNASEDGYNSVKGDAGTDLLGNTTSSNQPGFHSNDFACLAYSADGVDHKCNENPYPHPVIQVVSSTLHIEKQWSGEGSKPESITVDIKQGDDTHKTVTLEPDKNGNWSANVIIPAGAAKTYTVTETEPKNHQWKASYQYKVGDGNFTDGNTVTVPASTASQTATVRITNKQALVTLPADSVSVTKQVIGSTTARDFSFTMGATGDNAKNVTWPKQGQTSSKVTIEDVTSAKEKTASFSDKLTFPARDATYTFRVTEDTPRNTLGWKYDDSIKTVTVTVTYDEQQGKWIATTNPANVTFTNHYIAVSALPLTGGMTDRQWLLVGGSIGGLAVLLVGAAGIWNSKKRLV